MLATKCFFPLVCIVMMFSMVRARPMEYLAGYGDKLNDPYDWATEILDDEHFESSHASNQGFRNYTDGFSEILNDGTSIPVVSSSHHPNKGGMGLEPIVNNAYQKKELEGLVQMIKYFRPIGLTSGKRRVVNTTRKTFHDYGDRSQSILEELVNRSLPTSSLHIETQELQDMVPLMDVNNHLYFFARREDHLFYIFSRPDSKSPVQMYGHIKPGLTCEQILAWGKEKGFM